MSEIRDINLKKEGWQRILWAEKHMPILASIGQRFEEEQPFAGMNIAFALHLEAKSAALVRTIKRGGASMYVSGSNPQSTQDSVCSALVDDGCEVFAIHGSSKEQNTEFWKKVLSSKPHIVIDDGADLINLLLGERSEDATNLIGACEETTSGVQRLRIWKREQRLKFPVFAINDAHSKHWFDNYYGTGQSTMDAIMRTSNLLVSGMNVVIAGYGWCGRGLAKMAAGLGAKVTVTEIDPMQALLAVMDGFEVTDMETAAKSGDLFITATSSINVLAERHFALMKDGAILCNVGHFNNEIDVPALEKMAVKKEVPRENIDSYILENGNSLHLIAKAALVNIAAADGHPIEIMDMSFALQALCAEQLALNPDLEVDVYRVPTEIDQEVAQLRLNALGVKLEIESEEQRLYREQDLIE